MDILGIGIPELVFIALIALIILGPKEMQKTAQVIGKGLRKLVMSDTWRVVRETSQQLNRLPTKLMRDAAETIQDVDKTMNENVSGSADDFGTWLGKASKDAHPQVIASPLPPKSRKPTPKPAAPAQEDEQGKDA
jgi:Sec-independent protein translocase protein TatA